MKMNFRRLASLGLGGLGSLLVYAVTKVEDYELSLVGKMVGGGQYCISYAGGNALSCWYETPRILSLAEAIQNIQRDYLAIGIALGITAFVSYLVINSDR